MSLVWGPFFFHNGLLTPYSQRLGPDAVDAPCCRWINQLDPGIDRTPWREEERVKIKRLHGRLGNRWAAISKEMTDEKLGYRCGHLVGRTLHA